MDRGQLREKLLTERHLDIELLDATRVDEAVAAGMKQCHAADLEAYVRHIDGSSEAVEALVEDLVRGPKSLLEDDDLTAMLTNEVLPDLLAEKAPGDAIRVWVVNCGEGYLAWDMRLLLHRALGAASQDYPIMVLGTDPDPDAIRIARGRSFAPAAFANLTKIGIDPSTGAQLLTSLIKFGLFGVHDAIRQVPFTKTDLVICSGLLPRCKPADYDMLVLKLVHSLSVGGTLLLGRGESPPFDAEPPTPPRPFATFTKQYPRPFELSKLYGYDLPFGQIDVPVMVIDTMGVIRQANAAGGELLSRLGTRLGEMIHRQSLPILRICADAARQAAQTGMQFDVSGAEGDASAAPIIHGGRMASVAFVSADRSSDRDQEEAPTLASVVARLSAALWAREDDAAKMRKQAADVTERLYTHTQSLAQAESDLKSANEELRITNQDLSSALEERDATERALRSSLEREHRIAQTLQQALLTPVQTVVANCQVQVNYQAARQEAEVGGDFYHGMRIGKKQYLLALGDVSGKGLEAAVTASMSKYMLVGFASEIAAPEILLMRINEAICGQASDLDFGFITAVVMLMDEQSNTIYYANAGHEPAVYYSPARGELGYLEPTGRAIGLMPGENYGCTEVHMQAGDILFVFTDGLSEAGRPNMLGIEGLGDMVREHAQKPPEEITRIIYEHATRISDEHLRDDATSLLIKCG